MNLVIVQVEKVMVRRLSYGLEISQHCASPLDVSRCVSQSSQEKWLTGDLALEFMHGCSIHTYSICNHYYNIPLFMLNASLVAEVAPHAIRLGVVSSKINLTYACG